VVSNLRIYFIPIMKNIEPLVRLLPMPVFSISALLQFRERTFNSKVFYNYLGFMLIVLTHAERVDTARKI